LPKDLKDAIGNQILSVAKTVARTAAG
jgi:hypothetical protein